MHFISYIHFNEFMEDTFLKNAKHHCLQNIYLQLFKIKTQPPNFIREFIHPIVQFREQIT